MFPEWFQPNFNKFGCIFAIIFMASASQAALPALLVQVQKEYKNAAGIEAEFDQLTKIRSTKSEKKASIIVKFS